MTRPSKSKTSIAIRRWAKPLLTAILDGARQIATPTAVGTLAICIVFFPVVLLTGVARFLFTPLALAVVFAMLTSSFLSRSLVPTMARYLLPEDHLENVGDGRWGRIVRGLEAGFDWLRERIASRWPSLSPGAAFRWPAWGWGSWLHWD